MREPVREPVISFQNVSKSYAFYKQISGIKNFAFNLHRSLASIRNAQYEALRDISFDVYKGENFGIIGHNGAGKSTALGLIAGVLEPTRGRVVVRGRISPLLALGAGFHQELTGRENIILNGVLMGLTRREIMTKVDEIIDFAELGEFIDSPIRVYSRGMLARLGFAVVASLDPEILLIDEILGVGDIRFQKKCQEKMLNFKESGVTLLLVTHSIASIAKLCDRVLWIEDHVVKMIGDPYEIAEQYCKAAGVEVDLGTPTPGTLSTTSL
ncbi:MAG TPA: ABC transporter ATP-binding protein [Coleofasciculaceae cyanobacterium]|jgi:lipopolysaccharide transport system ATP-binding protein